MRFRRLNEEELENLESEFIQFLAVAGIEAQDWEGFKKTNNAFCQEKIEEFSDVVIGGVLHKAKYCEHRTAKEWMLFRFNEKDINLIVIRSKSDSLDLTSAELTEENWGDIELFQKTKPYDLEKEDELFNMMQKGCEITEGLIFEAFSSQS